MALALGAAGPACGPKDPEPCQEMACPTVDSDPGPGDYDVPLGGGGGSGTVTLQRPGVSPDRPIEEYDLQGGEVVFDAPSCAVDAPCPLALKRVRFELSPFRVDFSDGSEVSYDRVVVSFEAPIAVESATTTGQYVIPAGAPLRVCELVNGRAWQASSSSSSSAVLRIDIARQILSIDLSFALPVRADRPTCSESWLQADVIAASRLPWVLPAGDAGATEDGAPPIEDAATSDDAWSGEPAGGEEPEGGEAAAEGGAAAD